MKVHVYKRHIKRGAVSPHILAAIDGFEKHGIRPIIKMPGAPEPCDLAVVWGAKKIPEMKSGRRCLVLERGYVGDRFVWTSCGFDGLNGRADFRNENMPGDRWQALCDAEKKAGRRAPLMQPWRPSGYEGEYVLIMGQVYGDASLRGVDIDGFYRSIALRLRHNGQRVAFRNHPLNANTPVIPGLSVLPREVVLPEAIERARWVVTFNSNSGVDSLLAGVPVVACDPGSMVWGIAGQNPVSPPPMLDRKQWARNIAYCQWTLDEIRGGLMWDHLRAGMEKNEAA